MKGKKNLVYVCSNCGETSPRWLGKCPSCGEWNTMTEDILVERTGQSRNARTASSFDKTLVLALSEVNPDLDADRLETGFSEMDRVLGGGVVPGSVILLGGEPGAGKSTLLLQICGMAGLEKALYVTGEESVAQVKMRADRLEIPQEQIYVVAENDMDTIGQMILSTKPSLVVIDSIQTMVSSVLSSSQGSVSQVKECASQLLHIAKDNDIAVFIVGHVNKDGAIAGPKVMEHIVDTVLYFEGDRMLPYRILRAVKNRYGSTNEIGMFDMGAKGLVEIANPSEMLLEGRPVGVSGNCVGCIMEGTRPIMAEIQALATKTGFGTPRRAMNGVDTGRSNLLLAIIEKRAGFMLGNLDVYINVVGGIRLDETSCDLPICLAVISSIMDQIVPENLLAIGEVGLGGELRGVTNIETRLREATRIGFDRVIVPKANMRSIASMQFDGLEIVAAEYLRDCLPLLGAPTDSM